MFKSDYKDGPHHQSDTAIVNHQPKADELVLPAFRLESSVENNQDRTSHSAGQDGGGGGGTAKPCALRRPGPLWTSKEVPNR